MEEGRDGGDHDGTGGSGEKKAVKFSLAKAKPSIQRPPLPSQEKEYITSVDAEAGIVVLNPRAPEKKKAVPKQENTWHPEKRMKNIMMESDTTSFEMSETMHAGPKPDVQYGLTLMEPKELQDQEARENLTLEQYYEEMPVEEFGEALLRGMGWEPGKPIGRNSKTVVEPVEVTERRGTLGLGATPPP